MTPAQLRKHGERLYGRHWKGALARALDINPRTITRWLKQDSAILPKMQRAIKRLRSQS
jgi:hypothetical protein